MTPAPTPPAIVAELAERRKPGHPLESPFYLDREIFDLDVAAVFASQWIFVASEAEVREPGDFVTVDVGSYSVIVLRDDDGRVRAMHNVCRHRGSRLLLESHGCTGNIVCGYHQWTYGTDGSLLHAGTQAPGFDRNRFSLKPVAARSVAGLIFICLAERPPSDFDDFAEKVTPYLRPHQLGRTKVAAQDDLIHPANWKLVMENNRECYHCEGSHPELTCTFFPTYGYAVADIPKRLLPAHARYLNAESELENACHERGIPFAPIDDLSGRPTAFRVQREALDGKGESYTMDGGAASGRPLGDIDIFTLGRLSLHGQANSWFHFMADHAVTFSLLPLGPERTLMRTTWLVHENAREDIDYDVHNLTEVWRKTNEQDSALVQCARDGVRSPAYEPGPYSPTETHVDLFITWYIERLKEHLTR